MKKFCLALLIIIFSSVIFNSCKKDKGDPPVLPPQESMTIDFSNFASARKSVELLPGEKGTANSSWEFAATAAGIWKLIINTTLAVPVTAFRESISNSPVYVSSKFWQWSFSVTYLNSTYKARLTGLIRSTDVQWKMYLTKEGTDGFPEFLWFEGTSKLDATSGQWILYQSPAVTDALIQIDWTTTSTGTGTIKYSYIKNDSFKNSFIEYGLTTNPLNAYYTIHYYNGVKFSDVYVEWNTVTHNGHVKSLDYLGDNNWYCWDANKINTVCQ